jgi:hypothetical protein
MMLCASPGASAQQLVSTEEAREIAREKYLCSFSQDLPAALAS